MLHRVYCYTDGQTDIYKKFSAPVWKVK